MSNKILFTVGGVIGVILLGFIYWNTNQNLPKVKISNSQPIVKEIVFKNKPGPGLTRHSFEGYIKAINTEGPDPKIILFNESNLVLPRFVLTNSIGVWEKTGSKFQEAQISDIKIGSQVVLHVDKNDEKDFWIFRDVYIIK